MKATCTCCGIEFVVRDGGTCCEKCAASIEKITQIFLAAIDEWAHIAGISGAEAAQQIVDELARRGQTRVAQGQGFEQQYWGRVGAEEFDPPAMELPGVGGDGDPDDKMTP